MRAGLLDNFRKERGEGECFAPIATDAVLDSEETRVRPRDEKAIKGHQELDLGMRNQALDDHKERK